MYISYTAQVNEFLQWKLCGIFCIGRIYYKCICLYPNFHLVCLGPLPCIVPLLIYLLLPCFSRWHPLSISRCLVVPLCVCVFMHECNVSIGPQKPLCLHCSLVLSGCRPDPPPVVTQTVSLTKAFVTLLF